MSSPDGSHIPFGAKVALGQVSRHSRLAGVGFNPSAGPSDTLPVDAWGAPGAYNWLAAPTLLEVVSTSAADGPAGSGARTLAINVLDASWHQQTILVTLNGLTPVPLGQVWRINGARVMSAGSTQRNTGDLLIRDVSGGTVRSIVPASFATTRQAPFTVPAGYSLIINQMFLVVDAASSAARSASLATYARTEGGVVTRSLAFGTTNTTPYNLPIDPPVLVAEKTDFALIVVRITDNNSILTCAWNGFLKQN